LVKTFAGEPLAQNDFGDSLGTFTTNLDQVDPGSAIQVNWQYYRITAITITLRPTRGNVAEVDDSTLYAQPMYLWFDPSITTGQYGVAQALQVPGYRRLFPWEGCSVSHRPYVLTAATYSASIGTVNSAIHKYSPWLPTNNTAIPHYHFSYFIPESNPNNPYGNWNLYATVHYEFKGPR